MKNYLNELKEKFMEHAFEAGLLAGVFLASAVYYSDKVRTKERLVNDLERTTIRVKVIEE